MLEVVQLKDWMVDVSALKRPVVQRYCKSSWGSYIGSLPSTIFSEPGASYTGHCTQLMSSGSRMNLKRSLCSFPFFREATCLVTRCTFRAPASSTTAFAVSTALLADSWPSPRRSSLTQRNLLVYGGWSNLHLKSGNYIWTKETCTVVRSPKTMIE